MKKILVTLGIFSTIVLVCLAGTLLVAVGDFMSLDMDAEYATYAAAKEDGAILRGWLPDFVPTSATDIRESHNLDSNEHWLTFRFDSNDRAEIVAGLETSNPNFPRDNSTQRRSWWPDDLRREYTSTDSRYEFYTYRHEINVGGKDKYDIGYVAIEKERDVIWYWCDD
jgi:hypothetical protein